jgi:hypothetical protein
LSIFANGTSRSVVYTLDGDVPDGCGQIGVLKGKRSGGDSFGGHSSEIDVA